MLSARRPAGLFARLFASPPKVSDTRIFARLDGGTQSLAYQMRLSTRSELAMVLPIPIRPGSGEDAVAFVDLSDAPHVFDQLALCFAVMEPQSKGAPISRFQGPAPRLAVHSVGAFDASYVPTVRDFSRLDPRFRLPDEVWSALPRYADWGFAVFTLKSGDQRVHPMAFRFPTRDPERVFFPTVHVHDGEVHAEAAFDHELYWQGEQGAGDERGAIPASAPMETQTRGLVRAAPVRRRLMRGRYANDDVWIA